MHIPSLTLYWNSIKCCHATWPSEERYDLSDKKVPAHLPIMKYCLCVHFLVQFSDNVSILDHHWMHEYESEAFSGKSAITKIAMMHNCDSTSDKCDVYRKCNQSLFHFFYFFQQNLNVINDTRGANRNCRSFQVNKRFLTATKAF